MEKAKLVPGEFMFQQGARHGASACWVVCVQGHGQQTQRCQMARAMETNSNSGEARAGARAEAGAAWVVAVTTLGDSRER